MSKMRSCRCQRHASRLRHDLSTSYSHVQWRARAFQVGFLWKLDSIKQHWLKTKEHPCNHAHGAVNVNHVNKDMYFYKYVDLPLALQQPFVGEPFSASSLRHPTFPAFIHAFVGIIISFGTVLFSCMQLATIRLGFIAFSVPSRFAVQVLWSLAPSGPGS